MEGKGKREERKREKGRKKEGKRKKKGVKRAIDGGEETTNLP